MILNSIYGVTFRVSVIITISALMLVGSASATTYTVCASGCDFTGIQEAIDDVNTLDGDTIEVYSGNYQECFDINKQLHLQGIDTGLGKPLVGIYGGFLKTINYISVDGVTLEGFHIINSQTIIRSDNNILKNNFIGGDETQWARITLESSNNNLFINNYLNDYQSTLKLESSSYNTFRDNFIDAMEGHNAHLKSSNHNTFKNNIIDSSHGENALLLSSSHYNKIINNEILGHSNNIKLQSSSNNDIKYNTIESDNGGSGEYNFKISYDSNNNRIYYNDISILRISGSDELNIDAGINQWDDGINTGNHYSYYDESSEGCNDVSTIDGNCDAPYNIPGGSNIDKYPLTSTTPIPIPEFPTIILPIVTVIGLMFLLQRRR